MHLIENLSKQDRSVFAALAEIASGMHPVGRCRVAAAIKYKRTVVIDTNSYNTDPFQLKYSRDSDKICLHAEISALKSAAKLLLPKELQRSCMYVLRLKHPSGTKNPLIYGLAKPCSACERAIRDFGVGRVLFTTDFGGIERL